MSPSGFRVTRDVDKTIFHDVPIFAECDRGDLTFGSDWIEAAVSQAKQQERDGYLPPLHTRHHEPATDQTDAVKAVGVFRITGSAPFSFKGKQVTAVFADLLVTDIFMAGEIEKMKYPYRSVEIFDVEGAPKINGLALLDHEAPYLELPMLFAGEVDDRRERNEAMPESVASAINSPFSLNYSSNPSGPSLGLARRGTKAALLFKFPDTETMTSDKTSRTPAAANFADGEDKDKDAENMEGEDTGGMDVAAVCSAIESGAISVADMADIEAAIQARQAASPAEEEEAAPAPAPGADIMSGDKPAALNFARLAGENEALKARLDARDAADKRAADVGAAMKRLDGKPLGSDLEQRLVNFHDTVGGNEVAFKEYVDTMARTAGELPSDTGSQHFSAQPNTPKSAMAYQSLGGEAVDRAAHFARQYPALKANGMRASEDTYVARNMKAEGFVLEETATA